MDTRASHSPAASSASRNKPAVSPSPSLNANARPQIGMSQPSAVSATSAPSARTPRKVPSYASASSGKGAADDAKLTQSSSNSSLKAKALKNTEVALKPNKNEELLRAYRSDFDGMRALLTCKICDKLLYEPYTIACGHIYCYSCLTQWFVSNKKKTCPDCRTAVTQIPASTYLVREMIHIFISRAEQLPAGETLEQHDDWRKEEAELVKQDRENTDPRTGGLFKGCFNPRPGSRPGAGPVYAIRDADDGVDRCPLCGWELEDGECGRCGLEFDEDGLAYDGPAGDFSDMDESSEQGISSEDLDMEMEEEYPDEGDFPDEIDFDAFGEQWGDEWDPAYADNDPEFAVRRWLANGGVARRVPQYGFRARGPASHSAAGSRRRYSASLASEVITEDAEIPEEDEDDIDEDSSMNDFIDDGQTEDGTEVTSTSASQTPQSGPARLVPPRRNRNIPQSDSSSVISQSIREEEDDDDDDEDEDEGPIRPGRRRHLAQNRTLARANGSRRTASSTSTDASASHELEEETQALLQEAGWSPLAQEGVDEMEDDDGDESDGGRTTVGWEPTANSNNRVPVTISLTPTIDRPSTQTRTQPRVGGRRVPDGSRGLRRRSSTLSVSTVNYEDGEADDDDSEIDRDGDTNMSENMGLRSRMRLRQQAQHAQQAVTLGHQRQQSIGDNADLDTDDNSDTSVVPTRRTNSRPRQREYDPRISILFANHQYVMRELDLPEPFRATTPLARPRTANRNRTPLQSSGISVTPAVGRATPVQNESRPSSGMPLSQPIRRGSVDRPSITSTAAGSSRSERSNSVTSSGGSHSDITNSENGARSNRESSIQSTDSSSTVTAAAVSEVPSTAHGIARNVTAGAADLIDRPGSRLNARPPSAAGRRGSAGYIVNSGFPVPQNIGLNFAQRMGWQAQTRNPYLPFIPVQPHATGLRQQSSRRALREQSSTATLRPSTSQRGLRPQSSRAEIRNGVAQPQNVRSPPSQFNLRSQPSARRLNAQPSARQLRAVHATPSSPTAPTNASTTNGALPEDERRRRIQEVIRQREEALRTQQAGTNPFAGRRQSAVSAASVGYASHISSNPRAVIGGITTSIGQGNTPSVAPQTSSLEPSLTRRRSNRAMGLPAGAFASPQHSTYMRTRSGQIYGAPLDGSASLVSPVRHVGPAVTTGHAA